MQFSFSCYSYKNVKFLCLIEYRATKTCREMRLKCTVFRCVSQAPAAFAPVKEPLRPLHKREGETQYQASRGAEEKHRTKNATPDIQTLSRHCNDCVSPNYTISSR